MNKKKQPYVKPRCEVYILPQNPRILAGSGDGGMNPLNPFTPGNDPLSNP